MFGSRAIFLVLQVLATAAYALPASQSSSSLFPSSPAEDPFYQPPAGFESKAPGTILRERKITAAFLGLVPAPLEAYQLLYRTTAVNGSAIATATTIFKPLIAKKDRFVSFQTAYDSSATKCNPSFSYQLGTPQDDLISSAELLIIQAYISSGYIVASHDYEGPDAAFGAGHLEGMGVLDGIRAVGNFNNTLDLTSSTPAVAAVGYSGGAIATGWAAALHHTYAPELPVKGWVAGGVPANLTSVALFLDKTIFAGFVPDAIAGIAKPSAYGAQVQPIIDSIITEHGRKALEFTTENCAPADILNFAEQSVYTYDFQSLGPGLYFEPRIQKVLLNQTLGVYKDETPVAPVFMYHSTQDEIIPYNNTAQLYDSWCDYGADVRFTTFANGGHLSTEIVGIAEALHFVNDAFAGKVKKGCSQKTELASILNPLALGVELEPILVKLIELLLKLGNNDSNVKSDLRVLNHTVT